MKKMLSILMLTALIVVLAACGANSSSNGTNNNDKAANNTGSTNTADSTESTNAGATTEMGKIGISMPTKSSERWVGDGANMKKEFEALGYTVDLQYAEDVIENQVSQIENMITKGVKVLVIAAIDGESLTDVLQKAADADIKVIAYDRLIKNTEHVSYYATFDNFKVGVLQASYLEEKLGLKDGKGPFNIELFAGSPDDNNAYFFFDGAMSVLQPYIDNGKLVVKSGQTKMEQVATLRWDGATAQSRMDNLLSANYASDTVSAVLSPYDGISIGIISSLKGVGYGTADKPMPIITGQDAELASVKSIIAGEQTSTIFKDTRELAKVAVGMAQAVIEGKDAEVNDTKTYDNGVKVVPSFLLEPVSVDSSNYKQTLVDSGYYSEDELK
ncbi:multiple monosaccharide ABC transporter substrate-binding protein [Paenibacillus lupini]|uniref:multiple monosaccharide ABC transporter substrate-binding protein n=1 Tax=Paenibacillus lupini TaxID=1450204 RepID=UPI001421F7ED|nr:multiple monosaccharide ABC transporter substrate-binding protein [Paenibacillus lupini]NIK23292.1 putative multiple sugar transport system substrate-binding protein [Paenibacillus lupini]